MKTSGKRIGGYETMGKRAPNTPADRLRRTTKRNAKNEIEREAREAMFAAIHILLEAQRRAYAGEERMEGHVAAMQRVLRYVQRKVKLVKTNTGQKRSPK